MENKRAMPNPEKIKLQMLYQNLAEKIELCLFHVKIAILSLVNNDPVELGRNAGLIKRIERESDQIHDEVIQRMYGRETLVFSRQDRLVLIEAMDNIIDEADSTMRRIMSYYPRPQEGLNEIFHDIADQISILGSVSKELILLLFTSFKKAEEKILEIEEIRRVLRKKEFELLKTLYRINPPMPEILYYDRTIRKLAKIPASAKKLASEIRKLIYKYRL
jgi:uncharacterized protein Yka (UPF0111/DUF47 family)